MSNFTKCYRLVLLSFFHRSQSLSRTVVCDLVIIVSHGNCAHAPQQAIPCFKTQSRVCIAVPLRMLVHTAFTTAFYVGRTTAAVKPAFAQ